MARVALVLVASLVAVGLVADGRSLAIEGIHVYQRTFAPLAARAGAVCRFTPTCSHYAETVIARDGLRAGGWKALGRIVRCGPWTAMGTIDRP
jgi:putative membrane protein insertion efficiency factor